MFLHKSYVGKNLISEIQAKMVPAIEIAGFLNHLFLRNKLMKQPHFLHAATNSQKLKVDWKFLVGHGQKWEWWIWSLDSKINSKIFCMLVQIHAHKSCFKIFGVSMVKKGWDQSGNQDSKIDCISKMNRWSKLIFCTLEG